MREAPDLPDVRSIRHQGHVYSPIVAVGENFTAVQVTGQAMSDRWRDGVPTDSSKSCTDSG